MASERNTIRANSGNDDSIKVTLQGICERARSIDKIVDRLEDVINGIECSLLGNRGLEDDDTDVDMDSGLLVQINDRLRNIDTRLEVLFDRSYAVRNVVYDKWLEEEDSEDAASDEVVQSARGKSHKTAARRARAA